MKLEYNNLSGKVALIGAGPGDPELLTLRAVRLLQRAQVVLYDHLVDVEVLEHCDAKAKRVFVGKVPDGPRTSQHRINALLIDYALRGFFTVRLKGGDPFVFGRGGEEAMALSEAGICCEVVPGISSCIAAPAAASIPVTHRGVTTHFSVVTGVGAMEGQGLEETWRKLGEAGGTIVFLMGVRRLERIVDALLESGRAPSTPAAIVHSGTTQNQYTVQATLDTIVSSARRVQVKSPATLVVGEVVALREQILGAIPAVVPSECQHAGQATMART